MELAVQAADSLRVPWRPALGLLVLRLCESAKLFDTLRADTRCCPRCPIGLEQGAQLEYVVGVVIAPVHYDRSLVGGHANVTLVLELLKRFAHRSPADPARVSDLLLSDAQCRRILPAEDTVPNELVCFLRGLRHMNGP